MATGGDVVADAKKFVGVPYVWGGASPKGFDCSGLVEYVLGQVGIKAPRTSNAQWGWVQRIPQSQLQPGDLIFEQWPGDGPAPGHVVIYAGGNQVIEAPHDGANVRVRSWSPSETTIVGYGRPRGLNGSSSSPVSWVPGFGPTASSALNGLSSAATGAGNAITSAEHFFSSLLWLVNPENWVRILAGFAGFVLAGAGLIALAGAA